MNLDHRRGARWFITFASKFLRKKKVYMACSMNKTIIFRLASFELCITPLQKWDNKLRMSQSFLSY